MSEADKIRYQIRLLDHEIGVLGARRQELATQLLSLRTKFPIGTIIIWTDGRNKRGKVIGHLLHAGTISCRVQRIRSDGSLGGIQEVHFYHFPRHAEPAKG